MRLFAIMMLISILILAACSDDVDTGSIDPTSTPTEESAEAETEPTSEAAVETESTAETATEAVTEASTATATQPEPTATVAASPTPEMTPTPAATATPANQLAPIGSTITFDTGQTVTIHGIERPVTGDLWTPQVPTNEFMAIDAEECAGPNVPADKTVTANALDFVFIMPDNTRVEATVGVKKPALVVADLLAGDCVRGWVTIEIAPGVQPKEIRYEGHDWEYNQLIGRFAGS